MATALTAILASAALIGACSSDDKASGNGSAFNGSDGKGSGSAATSTTVAPQPTSVFDLARSTTCTADRQTLELAVEAFRAINESVPDEADLVATGFLREESAGLDVAADGSIVAAPGGPCAG